MFWFILLSQYNHFYITYLYNSSISVWPNKNQNKILRIFLVAGYALKV